MSEQLDLEKDERILLESDLSEQLVLEHPSYKQLESKLMQAEQKSQENWDGWLRTKAELENLQRRSEREIANAHKYGLEKFAKEILITVDNLERSVAAKSIDNGIELTLKVFLDTLQKFDITAINPINEAFNPDQHMAVMTKEEPHAESNTVLEVVQKGYWLKLQLVREEVFVSCVI